MAYALFSLGEIIVTAAAEKAIQNSGESVESFLKLHQSGGWGNPTSEDFQANRNAVAHEGIPDLRGRVFSTYFTRKCVKLYVITEHDRRSTCLQLGEEL